MKWLILVREAVSNSFKSLRGHFLRTILTVLSISIGIFTITVIFTLVDSLEYSISKNLAKIGNTVLYVHHWPWKDNSEDWHKYFNRPMVDYSDYTALKRDLTHVSGVAFEVTGKGQTIKYDKESLTGVEVKGVTYDYGKINHVNIAQGRYFSMNDVKSGRPVAVLGANVAKLLFKDEDPLGEDIRVGKNKVQVIGVQEAEGAALFGTSADDRVLLPFEYAARHYNVKSRSVEKLITVKADIPENVDLVESEITGVMRRHRGLKPAAEANFAINKQEMLMNQLNSFMDILRNGGIMLSIMAILIGGFAIGNIMYTSVKERTFEIGLQKALGASNEFILVQFLTEAVILCLIAGSVGLSLTFVVAEIAKIVLDHFDIHMDIIFTIFSISFGIILSFVIGLVAGIFPSWLASRLDPVEAMRK